MANEKKDQFAFAKYEGAQVAQLYAQAKDFKRAHIALLNTPLDNDAHTLIKEDPHYSRPEGIFSASNIYGNQFHQGLRGLTMEDLKVFYAAQIKQLSPVAQKELEALFAQDKDKEFGDIEDEYNDAISDLEDIKEGRLKRKLQKELGLKGDALEAEVIKRKKQAEKTQEKYSSLMTVKNLYQEGRNAPIMERTRVGRLEQIARGE